MRVLNDTTDYYRYFDATAHAEFLYECVEETVNQDLPQELDYLEAYDRFSRAVQGIADMPDRQANLLHRFLSQGKGRLSKHARAEEFAALTDAEVQQIEQFYQESFAEVLQESGEEAE